MTDKCKNDGNWLDMCRTLSTATLQRTATFTPMVMASTANRQNKRLAVWVGTNRTQKVELRFCPFCGINIVTECITENNQ